MRPGYIGPARAYPSDAARNLARARRSIVDLGATPETLRVLDEAVHRAGVEAMRGHVARLGGSICTVCNNLRVRGGAPCVCAGEGA